MIEDEESPCPTCYGTGMGQYDGGSCQRCNGTGEKIIPHKQQTVKLEQAERQWEEEYYGN